MNNHTQAPSKERFAELITQLEMAASEYAHHQGAWEADRLCKARGAVIAAYSAHEPPAALSGFSCAKRATDPTNEFAACREHCGDPRCMTEEPPLREAVERRLTDLIRWTLNHQPEGEALGRVLQDARTRLTASAQPPAPERQPIPVTEIVAALEREAANTDTDPRWMAAQCLRHIAGWESRTLMCHIDTRPSTYSTATKSGEQL